MLNQHKTVDDDDVQRKTTFRPVCLCVCVLSIICFSVCVGINMNLWRENSNGMKEYDGTYTIQ